MFSDLVPALRAALPALLDDVGRALASIDRGYAQFLAEQRLMVSAAAEIALRELVDSADQRLSGAPAASDTAEPGTGAATSEGGRGAALALFEEAGRGQARHSQPLLTLLLAYRAGGRIAWRHIAACAVELKLPGEALAALAEAVFRTVDEISAASTNGYLLEQAESSGVREQLLTALGERLLDDRADPAQLRNLSRQAGWTLPVEAALVLVRPDDRAAPTALARLTPPCLHVRWGEFPGLIVPDPRAPEIRRRLVAVLRCHAAVGPAVPLRDLPETARVTLDAVALAGTVGSPRRPFFVEDHMDAVIVHRDERLLEALRRRSLAPLGGAARGSVDSLRDTLRSWLLHMGDLRAVAAELQVHRQTVRYRMGRLHELFGPALDDPDARLRLLITLAWDRPVANRGAPRRPALPAGGRVGGAGGVPVRAIGKRR